MHSVLGLGSFCMNYHSSAAWIGSPGCFINGLQLVCVVGSDVSQLPPDNSPDLTHSGRVGWLANQVH